MIPVPSSVKVWLATGYTAMRRGFPGLSLMVQETLKRGPMWAERSERKARLLE
ncbi:transposase [Rhizobium beringeri]